VRSRTVGNRRSFWGAVVGICHQVVGRDGDRSNRVRFEGRRYTQAMRSHRWIDERSLALHSAVAAKLEAQPELLDVARQNLQRWLSARPAAALLEWQAVLDRTPLSEVIDLLRSATADAARLRQSSPFAGVLSPSERQSILDAYESRRA
jgi:hypothetical protein